MKRANTNKILKKHGIATEDLPGIKRPRLADPFPGQDGLLLQRLHEQKPQFIQAHPGHITRRGRPKSLPVPCHHHGWGRNWDGKQVTTKMIKKQKTGDIRIMKCLSAIQGNYWRVAISVILDSPVFKQETGPKTGMSSQRFVEHYDGEYSRCHVCQPASRFVHPLRDIIGISMLVESQ